MNRSSAEQALLSLLPTTHATTLPPALVEAASGLLAQSRHRASTLKADEEIARAYACAHLACDRLKTSLNLPPIDPRPPIPPRIYKRLYTHLDTILPASSSTPSKTSAFASPRVRTPGSRLRDQQRDLASNTSPLASKNRNNNNNSPSLSALRNRTTTNPPTPSKTRTPKPTTTTDSDSDLPRWMRPTLRHLLSHLSLPPALGPVIASGLESVLLSPTTADDAFAQSNRAAVLGALLLFVWRGVTWPGDTPVDRERYVQFRRDVAGALGRARREVEGVEWEGWGEAQGVAPRELDAAAVRGGRRGWFEMEWVEGVGDLVDRGVGQEERGEDGDGEGNGEKEVVVGQVRRRPDTMFQERYDYLGERKRKAYGEWKEGVMKRIRELEAR
ncbi:origin recognition complex subunit 6 [Staphylotrichum tortipilum]|uniref:Origin recognition complex subunit 6 n=1 Tax=Staphylotrichum tortipilum TaxID=2831512 RepID=A0AAN6ME55_9PEZI|nr:origin recognition complex subunit 6 [Staphylotrichum longicolle]